MSYQINVGPYIDIYPALGMLILEGWQEAVLHFADELMYYLALCSLIGCKTSGATGGRLSVPYTGLKSGI